MDGMDMLERTFGGRWAGIIFHRAPPDGNYAPRAMRFCEAVTESYRGPLILTRKLLDCPGGRRSLGWQTDDENLARTMAEKTAFDVGITRAAIKSIPRIADKIVAVTVGSYDSPDVVLSYAQPEAAMRLFRRWQQVHGVGVHTEVSSVMAVCGSVAVRSYLTGEVCLSFGCPDSRECGQIGRDRLVVGMPFRLVEKLFQEESEHAHV